MSAAAYEPSWRSSKNLGSKMLLEGGHLIGTCWRLAVVPDASLDLLLAPGYGFYDHHGLLSIGPKLIKQTIHKSVKVVA